MVMYFYHQKRGSRKPIGTREKIMNEQSFTHIVAPTHPLHRLTTPPLEEEAKEAILKHGCKLEEHPNECTILFPEGTTRTEIFLRTMNPRYQIKLPDGYEFREVYDRYREVSLLLYSSE
jgi:hypothetical protein